MLGKLLKALIGLALVALGALAIYLWWADLLVLVRGGVGLALILAGLIAFALVAD
jgi:hypothetical protein